eukprot:5313670-Karenia_brevis.AAC.1
MQALLNYRDNMWCSINSGLTWQHRIMHRRGGQQCTAVFDSIHQYCTEIGQSDWKEMARERVEWRKHAIYYATYRTL